jgi:transposase
MSRTIQCFLKGQEFLEHTGQVSKEAIDFLSRKIKDIEKKVRELIRPTKSYELLRTIPGVGDILALTILLETGSIDRFKRVGNYVSYCRKVSSQWKSNKKKKGKGNTKNGNKYLAWAFSEAAEHARRYDERCRAFYNRKSSKKNFMVAHNALAHKLVRAAYYIMKDSVRFDPVKLFG